MKRDDRPSVSELRDAGVADAFRPLLLAAAWRVAVSARALLGEAAVDEDFPFLNEYAAAFEALEDASPGHPLLTLAALADWPSSASEIWLVMGLIDEDARFGAVFQALDPAAGEPRPSLTLLQSWWGTQPREGLRPALRALLDLGLLQTCAAGAGRHDATYEVEENCWAAARGEALREPWPGIRLQAPEAAPALADLLLPSALRGEIERLAPLLDRHGGTLIVGGPEHNGRGSVLAALARRAGRQALFIDWPLPNGADAPRWLGAFATLAGARAIVRLRATPGERLRLPRLAGYGEWIGVACGDEETLEAPPLPAFRLHLPLPDAALREALLTAHGTCKAYENGETGRETGRETGSQSGSDPERESERETGSKSGSKPGPGLAADPLGQAARRQLAEQLHLSAGHLCRALAQGIDVDTPIAVQAARLREVALAGGSAELDGLARRLRHPRCRLAGAGARRRSAARGRRARSALPAARPPARDCCHQAFAARLNAGVRALLAGPSGTGKTLAALVLAERLGLPLYRLDLSSVVSKYIGETERNLHRLLAAAEALDVMLLLDEGDSLLARRTVGRQRTRPLRQSGNQLPAATAGESSRSGAGDDQRHRPHRRRLSAPLRRSAQFPPAGESTNAWTLWQAHLPPAHVIDAANAGARRRSLRAFRRPDPQRRPGGAFPRMLVSGDPLDDELPVRSPAPRVPAQRRPLSARPLSMALLALRATATAGLAQPQADPRFVGVSEQIRSAAGKLKKHPPPAQKARAASLSTVPPANERVAAAKARVVDSLKEAPTPKPQPNRRSRRCCAPRSKRRCRRPSARPRSSWTAVRRVPSRGRSAAMSSSRKRRPAAPSSRRRRQAPDPASVPAPAVIAHARRSSDHAAPVLAGARGDAAAGDACRSVARAGEDRHGASPAGRQGSGRKASPGRTIRALPQSPARSSRSPVHADQAPAAFRAREASVLNGARAQAGGIAGRGSAAARRQPWLAATRRCFRPPATAGSQGSRRTAEGRDAPSKGSSVAPNTRRSAPFVARPAKSRALRPRRRRRAGGDEVSSSTTASSSTSSNVTCRFRASVSRAGCAIRRSVCRRR
jgi:hypothetical protein